MLRLPISSGFEGGIPVRRYSVGLPAGPYLSVKSVQSLGSVSDLR